MKINHRIALRGDSAFWQEIQRLGLSYVPGLIAVLNITEDDEAWPRVERLLSRHGSLLHDVTSNLFTPQEIEAADWVRVCAQGHHGYPQPEEDFGYLQATYDTSSRCPTCGIGGVQDNPFRLKAESKAEHSDFLQLNWVFDELFIRPKVRSVLEKFRISGVSFVRPILHMRDQPSERVVQMKVDTVLPAGLDTSRLEPVTCMLNNEESAATLATSFESQVGPYCHRVKYHVRTRGPFRFSRDAFLGAPDLVKSGEWFGSGATAHRLLVASRRFREITSRMKWRGIAFEPIELVEVPSAGRIE